MMSSSELPDRCVRKILVLFAAVLTQGCLGGIYAWSAYVPALRSEHFFTAAQTQLVFGATIASFSGAMILAGFLLRRLSGRLLALSGGTLFALGHLIAGASAGSFLWLFAGFGLVVGISIGLGYASALTTVVRWFPRHRGLVVGATVAGYGGGAVFLAPAVSRLLACGIRVGDLMRAVGLVYGCVLCLSAVCLAPPPAQMNREEPSGVAFSWKTRAFWQLAAGMFCGTFSGLLVIGNLKPLGLENGLNAETAGWTISVFAVGNMCGRFLWGWLSDRLGFVSISLSLQLLVAALAGLLVFRHQMEIYLIFVLLVGAQFGACFVVYALQVARRFGAAAVADVYPYVFAAHGVAGVCGPPLGGVIIDQTGNHVSAVLLGASMAAVGACLTRREPPCVAAAQPGASA